MPDDLSNIIAFPRIIRMEKLAEAAPARAPALGAVVDHDGRAYALAALLGQLEPDVIAVVMGLAPRSGQQVWDHVARRFPRQAEAAVRRAQGAGG
jgi:hypothetical protein